MDQIRHNLSDNEIEQFLLDVRVFCYKMDVLFEERPDLRDFKAYDNQTDEEYHTLKDIQSTLYEQFRTDPTKEANPLYWMFQVYRHMFHRRENEWVHNRRRQRAPFPIEPFQTDRECKEMLEGATRYHNLTGGFIEMLPRDKSPFFNKISVRAHTDFVFQNTLTDSTARQFRERYNILVEQRTFRPLQPNGRAGSAQTDCSICGEDIVPSDSLDYVRLDCNHKYHPECINGWVLRQYNLRNDPNCPYCRAGILPVIPR